jgi:type I restriction enzyme S subunit
MTFKSNKVKLESYARITTGKTNSIDASEDGLYPLFDRSQTVKKSDKFLFDEESIIMPGEGAEFIPKYFKGKFDLHQRAYAIFPNDDINGRFLYYAFLNGRDYFSQVAVGSTVKSLRLNSFKEFEFNLLPLRMQKNVALILGAIDDRILLLSETNTTLEEILQSLFKSWFVDFDPVKAKKNNIQTEGMDEVTAAFYADSFVQSELGEIPNGWSVKKMEDIATVGIGKTPPRKEAHWFSQDSKDIRWASIRDMGIFGVYALQTNEFLTREAVEKFNVRIIPDNTVIMSFKMTIGRVALTNGEMATNEAIAHFKLAGDSEITSEFIYLHLKQFNYSSLSSTSSIADAVNSKTVREIPILMPPNYILSAFQKLVQPIFDTLKNNELRAHTLLNLRDTLLPRLISGKLRLPNLEEQIEAAT